jgi:hypothetical protein
MAGAWYLAQYNVAWLLRPLDDAAMADFHANLDPINQLGDRSPGFVWRHQADDGNSTSIRIRNDPRILINFSVWEDVESLFEYTYRSAHAEVYRRRKEWFEHAEKAYLVLWWVPAGHIPSVEEAEERLAYFAEHGPTPHAFTFKSRFPAPDTAEQAATSGG